MKNLFFVGVITLLIASSSGEQKNTTDNSTTQNVEVTDSTTNATETVKADTTMTRN